VSKDKSEFAGFSEFAEWLDQDYRGFTPREILPAPTFVDGKFLNSENSDRF
jgi:hypothetical protein